MKTKYSIVKESIKSKILDGTYQPYQKISSESQLMKEFGVSRHTVRLAVGDLVTEGWLYREQGSGTFCADRNETSISDNNSKSIAIVVTYISDYIFPSIISGAEEFLRKNGYQVSLFNTNNDHETERKILEKILSQNFDGIIIEPTKSAITNPNISYFLSIENKNIPYIMINAYYDELEPISLTLDDEKGGYLQAEHLINLGHKNIVGFFKTDDKQGSRRMKGFIRAHRDYNIKINPDNIATYNSDDRKSKPLQEIRKILALNKEARPTGVICYNDELAVMLLDVIREDNLIVPEDISLVGYDDSFLAKVSGVKLTTVKHPKSEMGSTAANLILELAKRKYQDTEKAESSKNNSVVFEPELIVRNSSKQLDE